MDRPVKRSLLSRTDAARCAGARAVGAALLALFLGLFAFAGCTKKRTGCDESKCQSGERCVQNECRATCPTGTECSAGLSCGMWGFADGTHGPYCVVLPGSDAGSEAGQDSGSGGADSALPANAQCATNADCATDHGEFCVLGTCRLACTSHFDCQGFGECASGSDSDGTKGHYCDLSLPQKPGQFYTHCPLGTECDAKSGFLCIGAGTDDLDAYCTKDCVSGDNTCADGFACTPLNRTPCMNSCGLQGNPKDRTCVPPDQIGPGKPYQCGGQAVTRNVCRPRRFCTSCTSDTDCLAVANQICAKDQSGAQICTVECDPKHPSCPWGNAGECGMWDADLGANTCAHRFGKCVGTGKPCEPCERDADCGANGVCDGSPYTGERWCVDLQLKCDCQGKADVNGLCTGGGCPTTPGGLPMECVEPAVDAGPNSGFCAGANTSAGALSASSPQTGCWPP